MTHRLHDLLARIQPVDDDAAREGRRRHAALAKPPGSLGVLEGLGSQLCAIAGRCPPPIPDHPAVVVAAGDHGVHAQGVTRWPRAVTTAMVSTVANGRAAVSVLAGQVGATVAILDVAVADPGPAPEGVRRRRVVADGTADLAVEPAMTIDQAIAAVNHGADLADDLVDAGHDLLAIGDLGIANTTASACLVGAMAGIDDATAIVGPGAGNDRATVARKVEVVAAALARHGDGREPVGVLASLGGAEHAALVGVVLAGAARQVPVVLDGVIADAAALVAAALHAAVPDRLLAGHRSTEPAATIALDRLGLRPLLDLDLRLGEGTGAVLAIPIVRAAASLLSGMATLEDVMGPKEPAGDEAT